MFYYTERDVRWKMMAEGKIIDVAVENTSHSIHLPKQSHQTKSQEFQEHLHSFTDICFQFKFRLWLSDLLDRAIDSDIAVLNREGDRLNYHPLPYDRLNWHTLLNQWEDRKFTWSIIDIVIVFALCKMLRSASTLHLSFINVYIHVCDICAYTCVWYMCIYIYVIYVYICDIKSSTTLSRLSKNKMLSL